MRFLIFLALFCAPLLGFAEVELPAKPASRVSDVDAIFDPTTRLTLSKTLQAEFRRTGISVYVVAMSGGERGKEIVTADNLRKSWISDSMGIVFLFTQNTDKVSVSLSNNVFRRLAQKGRMEDLANQIDLYNLDGPSRGMPNIVALFLNRLRPELLPEMVPPKTFNIPREAKIAGAVILALIGLWFLLRLLRFIARQNLFSPRFSLPIESVSPALGANVGGLNTAQETY